MLRLLEKRAGYLKAANFIKAREIEKQMTVYKNENLDKVTKPNCAYCTFQSVKAFQVVMNND